MRRSFSAAVLGFALLSGCSQGTGSSADHQTRSMGPSTGPKVVHFSAPW